MKKINYKRINTDSMWKSFSLNMDNLEIEGGLKLHTVPTYEFGKLIIGDNTLNITDITVDECDVIYMIDQNKNEVLIYNSIKDEILKAGCKPGILPVALESPSGIAIDKDTIYITDPGNSRLIALARSNLQIRWVLSKGPEENPLDNPIELVTGYAENIYLIERGNKRVLTINRSGTITDQIGSGVLVRPTDIAVDKDGDIYVLDGTIIQKFGPDDIHKEPISILDADIIPLGLAVDDKKQIFVGEAGPDNVLKTIHKISADGATTSLWSYRGATKKLISDSKGNIYVINDEGNKVTFLEYTNVNNLNEDGLYSGYYISRKIDAQSAKTKWHRFQLEGNFKEGTKVEFSYYVSDDELPDETIKNLPKRHPERQWHEALSDSASIQGKERRDALFLDDVKGRYLWFKITLTGNETITPVVKELALFFPRVTYLKYLPAIYQEDSASKEFLERFLSIFKSINFEIDFTIDHLSRFFDALGAPEEFLSWLGTWLAISADENWPEEKKRLLIQKAISLYKKRGTREGLEETIELFTDKKPYIVENFRIDLKPGKKGTGSCNDVRALFFPPFDLKAKLPDGSEELLVKILYGKEPFCFCVFLTDEIQDENTVNTIRAIVEEQKPAHTCYGLKVLEPWFYLDMHTYLGVNTSLTRPEFTAGKKAVISRDTVLDDPEQGGQIERHSRIGIDVILT